MWAELPNLVHTPPMRPSTPGWCLDKVLTCGCSSSRGWCRCRGLRGLGPAYVGRLSQQLARRLGAAGAWALAEGLLRRGRLRGRPAACSNMATRSEVSRVRRTHGHMTASASKLPDGCSAEEPTGAQIDQAAHHADQCTQPSWCNQALGSTFGRRAALGWLGQSLGVHNGDGSADTRLVCLVCLVRMLLLLRLLLLVLMLRLLVLMLRLRLLLRGLAVVGGLCLMLRMVLCMLLRLLRMGLLLPRLLVLLVLLSLLRMPGRLGGHEVELLHVLSVLGMLGAEVLWLEAVAGVPRHGRLIEGGPLLVLLHDQRSGQGTAMQYDAGQARDAQELLLTTVKSQARRSRQLRTTPAMSQLHNTRMLTWWPYGCIWPCTAATGPRP